MKLFYSLIQMLYLLIRAQIVKDFGSVDLMRNELSASTVAVQGSGWGWLGYDAKHKILRVATCKDQDTLLVLYRSLIVLVAAVVLLGLNPR